MPLIQCTCFYHSGVAGFSTTFFRDSTVLLSLEPTFDVATALARLQAKNVILDVIRCSTVGAPPDAKIRELPEGGYGGLGVGEAQAHDLSTGLKVRTDNADGTHRRDWILKGVPDDWITGRSVTDVGKQQWAAEGPNLLEKILDGDFGLKTVDPGNPKLTIKSQLFDVASNLIQLTTTVAHNMSTNDLVLIKGITTNPMVNGFWRVADTAADSILLLGSQRLNISAQIVPGSVQKIEYVLEPIANMDLNGIGRRKSGRPFIAPVGRRSARLLHR